MPLPLHTHSASVDIAAQQKAVKAEENRLVFGRPKKVKTLAEARKSIEVSRHEGHRLTVPGDTE